MKKSLVVWLVLCLVLGLTACGSKEEPAQEKVTESTEPASEKEQVEPAEDKEAKPTAEKKTVAYAIPGLTGAIWSAAGDAFVKEAETLGWEGILIDPNDNFETQVSMIQNTITKGIDALSITSIDGDATGPLLAELKEAGIPVFAIDRTCEGEVVTTIEADNYNLGVEMANLFVEQLGDKKGKVLFVGGPLNNSPTVARIEGFKSVIEGKENIEVVGSSNTEFDTELALANILNYLQANPDINCIYTCTDTLLPAIMTALEETGNQKKVGEEGHVFVGSVDGDGYGLQMVVDGYCDATYGLDPAEWAAESVRCMERYFNGESVDEHILISGNIVTADNFEELKGAGKLWGVADMK